jgi:hypothetical protein
VRLRIQFLSVPLLLLMCVGLAACSGKTDSPPKATAAGQAAANPAPATGNATKSTGIKIKVTADSQVMTAILIDNATTRSLIAKFPLTVPMKNLYSREMVYRFPEPLPAEEAQRSGYEVGDLSYWTPGHSLVIFYKQNGEVIDNLQKVGRFDSNLEFFSSIEGIDVLFELQ